MVGPLVLRHHPALGVRVRKVWASQRARRAGKKAGTVQMYKEDWLNRGKIGKDGEKAEVAEFITK